MDVFYVDQKVLLTLWLDKVKGILRALNDKFENCFKKYNIDRLYDMHVGSYTKLLNEVETSY